MSLLGVTVELEWALLTILAVAAGGFIRGFAGFGSALAMVPVLALIFEPRAAVAMHAVIEIPTILRLVPDAVRDAERRTVAPMLAALIVTTPLGALVLSMVDPEAMRVAISVMVLVMVAVIAAEGRVARLLRGTAPSALAGGLAGLIQGSTGVGGPALVAALLARGDPARTSRGNVILLLSSMIAVSAVSFAVYGLLTREVLVIGLVAAPVCLLATIAGAMTFERVGAESFRRVALVILALAAIGTLLAAEGGASAGTSPA